MVLGLTPAAIDRRVLRFMADFASNLHLEPAVLFLQDLHLAALTQASVVREFRVAEARWRQIEGDELRRSLEISLERTRRDFEAAMAAAGIGRQFRVMQVTGFEAMAANAGLGDILALSAPPGPFDRAASAFTQFVEAALGTRAAVLLVPGSVVRRRGPILTVAPASDKRILATATGIAAATRERVQVWTAPHRGDLLDALTLGHAGERMMVIARGAIGGAGLVSLAAERRVPILVVGAERAGTVSPAAQAEGT
jgi:hypothetical protein